MLSLKNQIIAAIAAVRRQHVLIWADERLPVCSQKASSIQTVSEKNIQWDFHLQEKNEV